MGRTANGHDHTPLPSYPPETGMACNSDVCNDISENRITLGKANHNLSVYVPQEFDRNCLEIKYKLQINIELDILNT